MHPLVLHSFSHQKQTLFIVLLWCHTVQYKNIQGSVEQGVVVVVNVVPPPQWVESISRQGCDISVMCYVCYPAVSSEFKKENRHQKCLLTGEQGRGVPVLPSEQRMKLTFCFHCFVSAL